MSGLCVCVAAPHTVPSAVATTTNISNPWSAGVQSPEGMPDADKWLHSVASSVTASRTNVPCSLAPAGATHAVVMATPATFPFQPTTSVMQSTYSTNNVGVVYPAQVVLMPGHQQFVPQQPFGMQSQQPYSSPQIVPYPSSQSVSFNGFASHPQPTFPTSHANWNAMNSAQQAPQTDAFSASAVASPARQLTLSTVHATAHGGTNGGIVSVSLLPSTPMQNVTSRAPSLSLQGRSQTVDAAPSSDLSSRPPTLAVIANQSSLTSQSAAAPSAWTSFNGSHAIGPTTLDPFDVAWAAKAAALNNSGPSSSATVSATGGDFSMRSFHVNL